MFAVRVAQAMKNTHFSHPYPMKSISGFVFQMFMSNFVYLELFSIAWKIWYIKCRLYSAPSYDVMKSYLTRVWDKKIRNGYTTLEMNVVMW